MSAEQKARFHDLGRKRDEILRVSTPLREERDALLASIVPEVKRLEAMIKQAEVGLFEIDRERGGLARALKGRTGEPS